MDFHSLGKKDSIQTGIKNTRSCPAGLRGMDRCEPLHGSRASREGPEICPPGSMRFYLGNDE